MRLRNLLSIPVLGLVGLIAACDGVRINLTLLFPQRADDTKTARVSLPAGARVVVNNDVGSTRVTTDPAATGATVEITRIAIADTQAEADDLLSKIVVDVTEPTSADNTLHIMSMRPADVDAAANESQINVADDEQGVSVISITNSTRIAQVELRITLPPGHGVDITQDTGNIRATALDADSTLKTRRGTVRSISAKAKLTVETHTGGIRIDAHRGPLDLTIGTGSLEVELLDLASDGQLIGRVQTGSIDLRLLRDIDADVQAIAELGDIEFDRYDFRKTSSITRTGDTLSAVLNDGGAVIDVRTELGSIDIRGR